MASKLILRSFKNLSSVNRVATDNLLHIKPNYFKPISVLHKNFSVSISSAQSSNANTLKDLGSFLQNEIKLEKENLSKTNKPVQIQGFDIKTEGPNVTLTKTFNNEQITVKFNITNSVGDDESLQEDGEAQAKENEPPAMKSRPPFTVDIKKGNKVLTFWCSFLPNEFDVDPKEGPVSEDFQIDEFAVHDGEWNENVYSADATLLEGNLYDILLNVLDERGIGEDFANQLMEYSTQYEHKTYVNLLEQLKDFAK